MTHLFTALHTWRLPSIVHMVRSNQDGSLLIAMAPESLYVLDASSKMITQQMKAPAGLFTEIVFESGSSQVIAATDAGKLYRYSLLVDSDVGSELKVAEALEGDTYGGLCFDQATDMLWFFGLRSGTLYQYDLGMNAVVRTLSDDVIPWGPGTLTPHPQKELYLRAFDVSEYSANGHLEVLSAEAFDPLVLVNLEVWAPVSKAVFSPAGDWLVMAGLRRGADILNAIVIQLHRLPECQEFYAHYELAKDGAPVFQVRRWDAVDFLGDYLVWGTFEGRLGVMHLSTPSEVAWTPLMHGDITSLHATADGTRLVASDSAGDVLLLSLNEPRAKEHQHVSMKELLLQTYGTNASDEGVSIGRPFPRMGIGS